MRLGILTALLLIFHMQHVFRCSPDVIPGYLDFDNLPDTNFSCEGKVIGGYYADVETGCQMFHVCTIGQKGETTDIKFLCLNGTVFDQETRVCERVDEVDCSKTEGFYNLNLELYGNSAAFSFPEGDAEGEEDGEGEEEGKEELESHENAENSDTSSNGAGLKHKASTSKPSTPTSSSSNPNIAHPASTTTPKTPVHPFVPTTTYKPSQHLTHFHSTTTPSIAAFIAINNAFSSSTTNQEGSKFGDSSSQYDEDEVSEEGEEEEEEEDEEEQEEEEEEDKSITDRPGPVVSGGTGHHFPATTASSQNRPVSPGHHNIPQQNVKVHGTGESGVIINQPNRQQPQKSHSTSTHSPHLYGHQTPLAVKDTSAHSKHQLNTQFILNQQRDNENRQHHGFKTIPNPDNKNQFLFSSTTRRAPVLFTTKSPSGYSSPAIEPFSHHVLSTQPPLHVTQRPPNKSPFPPQTNAHQVPPNPQVHQIRANIANDGGFLSQTIQISQNPLTFQFNTNGNNHQLFTTPSVAVVATTSSTSSSSSARTGSTGKVGNISPVISLTSSIGNTHKGSGITNNSSVSIQLFTDTTPPNSYDEYQEEDVHSDPFFRDVPKIAKPSTTLKTLSPTRHGIVRNKRESPKKILVKTKSVSLPLNNMRYKRKAVAKAGLPTEVFGTGEGRYRSRPGGPNRSHVEESVLQNKAEEQISVLSHSRRTSISGQIESKQNSERSRPSPFVAVTHEVSTTVPEVSQQAPQFSGSLSDISVRNSAPKHLESIMLNSPVRTENHQSHGRTPVKVTRPYMQNVASDMFKNDPSEISGLYDHTGSFQHFISDPKLHLKSTVESPIPVELLVSTSGSKENSYGNPKTSVLIRAEGSQMLQNFTKNVPVARSHGRGQHRHLQHQQSRSNLIQEGNAESRSGHSRQGSRQRSRIVTTGSAHENDDHQQRSSLTFQPRGNMNAMKAASRIADNRYSDSRNRDEKTLYSHSASPHSRIRFHGQKLDIASKYQDVAKSDSNKVIPSTSETHVESGDATEPVVESSYQPQTSVPKTNFTCADKIPGGYYADLEADCQLFHVCSMGRHGKITDNMFLCGPGTRFDQRSRTCQAKDLVDCSLSASLYYLNSHFQLNSADDISTHQAVFEAKKIRARRETIKELSPGRKQPYYNIDNLPETSFTCADKPQDGLYADVETQCHVFHLCRTISGELTLESSFVCPPGTVFNQPEGNCDTKNEVDCALYSAPEHAFKKTAATGTRNQGLKSRQKRHTPMEGTKMKLRAVTTSEKKSVYKNVMYQNYRMKRETEKETFDYYDYVDDNYEAHAVQPINENISSEHDKVKQSKHNTANYEEYVYESTPVSAKQGVKAEPYLFNPQGNEKDGQKYVDSAANDKGNKGPKHFENSLPLITESTLLLPTGTVAAVEEIVSVPIPYQLVLQNKSESVMGDKLDYIYEYEYDDDDDTAVTTAPPVLKQTNSALDNKSVKNYMKSMTSDLSYDVENSYKLFQVETNDSIKHDAEFSTVTQSLIDSITLPTSTKENNLVISDSGNITTKPTLEAKALEYIDPANVNVPSVDHDYEYYYDEVYTDSNETEYDSNIRYLPSLKTEDQPLGVANKHSVTTDSGDGSAHYVVSEEIKPQIHRPSVKVDNVSGTHETVNFNTTVKVSEELNIETPATVHVSAKTHMKFETDVAALNKKKSTSNQRAIISELLETIINPTPLQESDRTTKTTPPVQSHKKLQESSDDGDGDDITLASLTTQLLKHDMGMETTISGLALGEEIAANHKPNLSTEKEDSKAISSEETTLSLGLVDDGTNVTTTVYRKKSSSHVGSSNANVDLRPPLQAEVSLSKPPLRTKDLTTFTEVREKKFSAQIPFQSVVKSMLQPLKPHNTFRSRFSTLVSPSFVLQSRETAANSTNPTIERNGHSVATNFTGNNVTEAEGKKRVLHIFGLAHNENHLAHFPQQVNVSSATVTLPTSTAADDDVIDYEEARSQNTVPSTQSSEMSKSEQNSSTAPHVVVSSYDEYNLETEIPLPFAKSSKINSGTMDKFLYSKNKVVYSSSDSADSTLSSKLPIFPPMEILMPNSAARYSSHNFTAVNSSVESNDDIMLNNFTDDNSSLHHAFRNIFQLSKENPTSALVFSINNLAVPVTTTPSSFDIPLSEPTEVLPNTSPSFHLGYMLSAVTSQPSVSADTAHTTGFVCTGRELYRYHSDTDDCRMFHYCSPGFHDRQVLDFRFICQNGTAFKADTHKCENEFLVPTCLNYKVKK